MQSYAEYIPPRARFVLELGCGDGTTAREFKRIQPDCRYFGVEEDAGLLQRASAWLDGAACVCMAAFESGRYAVEAPDCIVLHSSFLTMRQPGPRIRELAGLLAVGGQFLLILENPGYLGNLLALYSGRTGVVVGSLSLAKAGELLSQAGLLLDRAIPQYAEGDQEVRQQAAVRQLQDSLAACAGQQKQADLWAQRFVIRAVRLPEKPPHLLLHVWLGEARVTGPVRVLEPNAFCVTEPGVNQVAEQGGVDLQQGRAYEQRVLLRQRCRFEDYAQARQQIEIMLRAGYLVVVENDDYPEFWLKDYERTKYIDYTGVHAIQVSTPALAEYMRQFNPHVRVFENELKHLPEPRVYDTHDPVTIFFGALNRTKDWQEIMPGLNALLKRYGDQVRVRVLFDRKFYEALETEHKELIGQEYPNGYAPYEVYEQVLHTADISLLPLRDTTFNRMKSDLKFIESAGHGAVVLASPTVYEDSVQDGLTGMIYRSPKEFGAKLTELIEKPQRRRIMARSAYQYVKEHRLLCQHYEERLAWYRSLVQRLPELTAELRERIGSQDGV